MDKAQVQKSPAKTHGKQNSRINRTRASKNKHLNGASHLRALQTPNHLTSDHLSALHQSLGNRAVGRLIQAKLTIGEPDDKYEREADQVADKVMRMPEPASNNDDETTIQTKPLASRITPLIQRAPEDQPEEDESMVQMMPEEMPEQEEETVAAKPLVQRQPQTDDEEEEPVQSKLAIQRQVDEDEEEPVQAKSFIQRQESVNPEVEETAVQTKPFASQITPLVQRAPLEQPDEDESMLQMMPEEMPEQDEETVAAKPLVQRQPLTKEDEEVEPIQAKLEAGYGLDIQRQMEDEEEITQAKPLIQRQTAEDEEAQVQTKATIQRRMDEGEEEETAQAKPLIQRQVDEKGESLQAKHLPGYLTPQVPKAIPIPVHSINPGIQRVCTECEEEMQRQPVIQPKGVRGQTSQVSPSVAANIQSMNGGGKPLPWSARSFFEPRFGADFSGVRVHTDTRATETAKSINARAFTVGRNIAFGAGQYAPETHAGRRLLGHELTHTLQQGVATPTGDARGPIQRFEIQRDAECEAEEEARGSEEQAREAETAPTTGRCTETNPPAEQPPEGAEEPQEEETFAEVEANEGAPVDQRQSNAPPPDENAPQREEGIAENAEQSEAAAPQDPCAVREAAGAGSGDAGGRSEKAGGAARGAGPQPSAGPPGGRASEGTQQKGEQQASTAGLENTENSFLVEAAASTAANLNPEGLGEAASPDVAAERDQLSVSADEAITALTETSASAVSITGGGVQFADPNATAGETTTYRQAKADHQRTSAMANVFLTNAGQRFGAFTARAIADTAILRASTQQRKDSIATAIEQHRASTRALMAQLRAAAQTQAQAATQQVEARHLEVLSSIEARVGEAEAQIEATYEEKVQQLEQAHTDQLTRLDQVYQTGHSSLIQIGRDKGALAIRRAGEHEQAYRRGDGAGAKQRLVRNREKDGFWDGYLTYNRYMARADAAKEVGEQYRDGFQEEAQAQADNMMCGKSRDIETTQAIIDQSRESLGCARDNAIDSIENQRQSAIAMAEQAKRETVNTIQSSLQATLLQLVERETGQLQLLRDYGIRQEMAIERDSERAVGAVLQGVNDASVQILQYFGQFRAQVESTEAPAPDAFSVQLAAEEAQLAASFAGAHSAFDQALVQSQTSLDAGQQQAIGAITKLSQRGVEDAQQLANGFHQATADLVGGAMSGFDQIMAAFEERMTGELDNSTQILDGVVTGTIGVFERINSGIEGRFQESANQMAQGMQTTLERDLDQKVCAEAEKAAADVQPWWKDVLKVLLIIVVIVVVALVLGPAIIGAVGAAATALAGSLGAGAALAGTIGAWVGPIVGGAIVGAIAGAAIQLGSNALYNKSLSEGLWEAVIAGAIGGALGGVGGQLGQVLVGKIASTALSRVVQYGTDVAFDIVGGILGDLAAGNPITWESVVMGLAIGGAVQVSMGGVSRLAGARAAARTAGGVPPGGVAGRLAGGRLGHAAEYITDLQGRTMAAGERLGARLGGIGPNAPTAAATSKALAGARARMEKGELPTRGGTEPEGWRGRTADESPTGTKSKTAGEDKAETKAERSTHENAAEAEPGTGVVAKRGAGEGHEVKVLQDGRVIRCSTCAELSSHYRYELDNNPGLKRELSEIEQIVDPAVKARRAADLETRLRTAQDDNYVRYQARKAREGMPARSRQEWLEVRNYMLYDSPLARGNRFNTTANKHYEFMEVHLGNGKRVDAYVPPRNGQPGEIISRKAIDFDDIVDESAFRRHLDEMLNKYAPDTPIASRKYAEDFGTNSKLEGDLYLEVPATNQSASRRARFEQIAASIGIRIRYTAE
jgi:Domain of unknown function (DUF4157)